jgi:hypothetical protein
MRPTTARKAYRAWLPTHGQHSSTPKRQSQKNPKKCPVEQKQAEKELMITYPRDHSHQTTHF